MMPVDRIFLIEIDLEEFVMGDALEVFVSEENSNSNSSPADSLWPGMKYLFASNGP